jgi:Thioesterase-like superfamily
MADSLYRPLGDGRFLATELTQGPWDPRHQHGSPPAALFARQLERTGGHLADMAVYQLAVDILGPIPVGEITVRTEVVRPGRRVRGVAAEMVADGRPVARAHAWMIRRADTADIASTFVPARLPRPDTAVTEDPLPDFGYFHACEWRFAEGAFLVTGPGMLWARLKVPVVPGEEPSALQRVAGVADTASGISSELSFAAYTFANLDFTLHLLRELYGEWVCLDAVSTVGPGGSGLCRTRLYDDLGDLGSVAQTLFVARRD